MPRDRRLLQSTGPLRRIGKIFDRARPRSADTPVLDCLVLVVVLTLLIALLVTGIMG